MKNSSEAPSKIHPLQRRFFMKKLMALLLAICMCLSLGILMSACGKDTQDPTNETESQSQPNENQPEAFVMDHTVANRVYSLLGEENEGMISVAVNKDGLFLAISSHDIDLSLDDEFGDIAKFKYDDNGKMTHMVLTMEKEESFPVTEYDEDGKPTKVENVSVFSYTDDTVTFTLDQQTYWTFDQYGRCVHYKTDYCEFDLSWKDNVGTWTRVDEEEEGFYVVTYESNTKLAQMEDWNNAEDMDYLTQYKYNEKGLPVEYRSIEDINDPSEGGYMARHEYNADEQIVKTEEFELMDNTEIKEHIDLFIYDTNKNLIEEKWCNADGTQYGGIVYTYDEKGNLTKEDTTYHPDNDLKKIIREYQYDENGTIIQTVTTERFSDRESYSEKISTYDKNGNVTRQETTYHPGNDLVKTIYEYQYDENDNCVKTIVTEQFANGTETRNEYDH